MQNPFKQAHRRGAALAGVIGWARKIFWFEVELSQHILHGNAFAAALSKPRLTLVKAAAVLLCDRFVVRSGGRYSAGYRIEQHKLQESNGGSNLGGWQAFDQFMRVLLL